MTHESATFFKILNLTFKDNNKIVKRFLLTLNQLTAISIKFIG